ncbi:MAG: NPCBM/NEW2 domain-containing protein [Pirellulales bacterium]|nr:NPCBM/NEW2 domain-containing protein [Pirellulales bacterium]
MIRCLSTLLVAMLVPIAAAGAEEPPPRYLAVFADGTRVEGQKISDWHQHTGSPKLDSTNLQDPHRPLRWLCDKTLEPFEADDDTGGFVEMIGGDRLPGRVVGFRQGEPGSSICQRPHLLVAPRVYVNYPDHRPRQQVGVLLRYVRRVVFGGRPRRHLEPGTAFSTDGRRLDYRSLRWAAGSVVLLLKDGVQRIALAELAEIHLPHGDPWKAYFEELAVLSPRGDTPLVRLETTDGLIATTSALRFRAASPNSGDVDWWYHMVQPVWSLEPLWIRFSTIRTRLGFLPHEVPLSRLYPVQSVQRSMLGRGWHWQADRNAQGGPLQSGDRRFAWGFGVHAANELTFELPEVVRALRSRIGLDASAGGGGCARALVYVDHAAGNPLFRSDHLIGSASTVDTGWLSLSGPSGGQHTLILATDAAHDDRPAGADPLDVRDVVDWIEPVLALDAGKLKQAIQQARESVVPAWDGWTASVEGGSLESEARWDESDSKDPRYVVEVATGDKPLTLSTRRRIPATGNWLCVQLKQLRESRSLAAVEIRAGGRPIASVDLPAMRRRQREPAEPFWVPLRQYAGREIEIDVVYTPAAGDARTAWQTLALADHAEGVHWTTLKPKDVRSLDGSTIELQGDGSVLAGAERQARDTYVVAAETGLAGITAFRLEALPERSMDRNGPGWGREGEFVLSQFRVGTRPRQQEPLRGRYVRIELPGGERTSLSLAEVQVFAEGKNMAPGGKATQSSVGHDAPAERAIDNNTRGDFWSGRTTTHTSEDAESLKHDHWWELDLGEVKAIDRLVIWNRTDNGFHTRLSNFRVALLDAERRATWQRTLADPPLPCVELEHAPLVEIPLVSAVADFCRRDHSVTEVIENLGAEALREQGWGVSPQTGQPHAVVFQAADPVDAGGAELVFHLKQLFREDKWLLGRFRLSATTDRLPPDDTPSIADVSVLPDY